MLNKCCDVVWLLMTTSASWTSSVPHGAGTAASPALWRRRMSLALRATNGPEQSWCPDVPWDLDRGLPPLRGRGIM